MALAVTVTQLVVPQTGSYNLTLLVLPAIVALRYFNRMHFKRHWYALAGRAVVWATLAVVPWLLWLLLTGEGETPIDIVLLPLLILLAMLPVLRLWYQERTSSDGSGQDHVTS
jgi:hypothetical protein